MRNYANEIYILFVDVNCNHTFLVTACNNGGYGILGVGGL